VIRDVGGAETPPNPPGAAGHAWGAFAFIAFAPALAGCAGGAPLLHPAHVLPEGAMSLGAGLSGQVALKPSIPTAATAADQGSLQNLGVSPGVAPWISGRLGFAGSNEAGLTYSGREVRLDGRHAFSLGKPTLSVGLGVSAILAHPPGSGNDPTGVYGAGFDVPVLIGVHSVSDIYAFWFGPRAGFEYLAGGVLLEEGGTPLDVHARHFYGSLVAGFRVGFRHVHVALELDASYHRADGSFAPTGTGTTTSASVQQITLTPAGALEVNF
jgi:hypothetical protein